jgi:alpha-1,2-mannosyltransferase
MYHYSFSLRTASVLMVGSTWTKNHVDAILQHRDFVLDLLYLAPPLLTARLLFLSECRTV